MGSETLSFGSFTDVDPNADGSYTVTGLTTGRHIIKVEKNGAATYQVVTAQKVSYKIMNADCTEEVTEVKPGDTVVIQFTGLTDPCLKLSGVYNNNANIHYEGEDGTVHDAWNYGIGVYDFTYNPVRQRVTVTVPTTWEDDTYTLSGGNIHHGGLGWPAGSHRTVTYEKGLGQNFSARSVSIYLSSLPDITLNISGDAYIVPVESVKLSTSAYTIDMTVPGGSTTVQLNATVAPENAANKNVTWSSSDESVATVDQNGLVTAVSGGEAIITVTTEDGEKTATCTITVKDQVEEAPGLTLTVESDGTACELVNVGNEEAEMTFGGPVYMVTVTEGSGLTITGSGTMDCMDNWNFSFEEYDITEPLSLTADQLQRAIVPAADFEGNFAYYGI